MSHAPHIVWYLRRRGAGARWHTTVPFATHEEALQVAIDTERMGYPCVVVPAGGPAPTTLDPAWWDYRHLCRIIGGAGDDVDLDAEVARATTVDPSMPVPAPLPPPSPPATTCIEHAYGSTYRLPFQIKVF